jgi:hypothetical protein
MVFKVYVKIQLMKWFSFLCICFLSCGQNNEQAKTNTHTDTTGPQTTPKNSYDDSITQKAEQMDAEWLIVPGESIGRIKLGTDAAGLEKILHKPDLSNAAMGKAWLTWKGKRDEHNNATELNVYTTYKDSTMQEKTVQQIRTTSSSFSTADSLHVYASLEEISAKFPGIKKRARYNEDGRDIIIYDDKKRGIAFEIAGANKQQICTGIIVHPKGKDVTEIYISLHPGMKLY